MMQYSDGMNLYGHVENDPINEYDSYGLLTDPGEAPIYRPPFKICKGTCGPDVTPAMRLLNRSIWNHWQAMGKKERFERCTVLWYTSFGWDISQLNYENDLVPKVKGCPAAPENCKCDEISDGENQCKNTVTVSGKCYAISTVNYWLFGRLSKLCGASLSDTQGMVSAWKLVSYGHKPDQETTGWVTAGYNGGFSGVTSLHSDTCKSCSKCFDDRLMWRFGSLTEFDTVYDKD